MQTTLNPRETFIRGVFDFDLRVKKNNGISIQEKW